MKAGAFEIFAFPEAGEPAPTWVASVLAINLTNEHPLIWQAVVLVAANTEKEALDKALNVALRRWKITDGWEQHNAVVSHLQTALDTWRA